MQSKQWRIRRSRQRQQIGFNYFNRASFVGTDIPKKGPVFRYEGFSMEEDDDEIDSEEVE